MSDDLVKRLRATCNCNIESTPCMAEEECRVAQDAADRIDELEAKLAKAVDALEDVEEFGDVGLRYIASTTLEELKGQDQCQP